MASDSKKTFGAKSPLKKNMCITTSSSPSYTRVFNSEFSTDQTMVDDFFKNSSEIQKELFKLSSIFRSPQKKTRMVSDLNKPFLQESDELKNKWAKVNPILQRNGYPLLKEGDYQGLLDAFIEVLEDKPCFPNKCSPRSFVSSFSEGFNSPKSGFLKTSYPSKEEKIFEKFFGKQFDSRNHTDVKVMGLITMYEERIKILKQKTSAKSVSNKLLVEQEISDLKDQLFSLQEENQKAKSEIQKLTLIKEKLELQNSALTDSIQNYKDSKKNSDVENICNKVSQIEHFIREIYSKIFKEEFPENYSSALSIIYSKLHNFLDVPSLLAEVSKALEFHSTDLQEILDHCSLFSYFKSLFEIKSDFKNRIDNLFLTTHEIKAFVQFMKGRFQLRTNELSEILETIKNYVLN